MKLSELEERARQEREEAAALAAEQELEKQIAATEAAEEFRQEVIAWMVEEGSLDAEELEAALSVMDLNYRRLELSVPKHAAITFRVIRADEGFAVRDGRFEVEESSGDHTRHLGYDHLGSALLAASEEWLEQENQQAKKAEREAERELRVKLAAELAAERGAKYLALLDEHPILQPILDLLGAFMEERKQLAEDLEMAEEFASSVEAQYQKKLEQAQHEARRADEERDQLQHDLWDEQQKRRDAERNSKRGW